jgi:hypothetical protein
MTNAKNELFQHIADVGVSVQQIRIVLGRGYGEHPQQIVEGNVDQVLPKLDFDYDASFGDQYLFGYVWYEDKTWSERAEYDGSEWWEHMTRPPMNIDIYT